MSSHTMSQPDLPDNPPVSSTDQDPMPLNKKIKIEAHSSNVNITGGSHNTIHQYQGISPSKIPPERIEYNVQNPIQSFTGRENILQALYEAIEKNRQNGDLTILTNVVTGLGGIGKTETVRNYIQKYKANYGHVLWINAETRNQARDCVIAIATRTNVISFENIDGTRKKDEEIAAEVYSFICKKPAIIVFDNANSLLGKDGEDGIAPLLPRSLEPQCVQPAIVVTSRNKKWVKCLVIALAGFDDGESYNLLIKELEFMDTQKNRLVAAEITQLCDGLPLVIQQVIGVIKMESAEREVMGEAPYGMHEFCEDYQSGGKSYIGERPNEVPADLGVSYTVYNVFKLTFQKIGEKQNGEVALECLNILSLLNPDGVPVDLLLSFFNAEVKDSVPKALILLQKHNLLNISEKCINVHRMVQKVRLDLLKHSVDKNLLRETIISKSKKFCEYLEGMTSKDIHKFLVLENGIRLANVIFNENCGENARSFLITLGDKYLGNGKYYNASYIFKSMSESSISDAQTVLAYKKKLARTCLLDGKFTDAQELYTTVLESLLLTIGSHHPSILTTKFNLAEVLRIRGKFTEAEELLTEVLTSNIVLFGPEHLDTLSTKQCLANVFEETGRLTKAEELFNEVLKSKTASLGSDHRDTLTTKHNLAQVYKDQGKFKEAEELFNQVLNSYVAILGHEHPNTLITKQNLAGVFEKQEKFTEAEEILNQVMNSKIAILGPQHPCTLTAKHNLAYVFNSQGKFTDAEELFTQVLKSEVVILGPEHPNTLTTKHNLARVFYRQGKFVEAKNLFTEVLESRMVVLGPGHPETLTTKKYLTELYKIQGKYYVDENKLLFQEGIYSKKFES